MIFYFSATGNSKFAAQQIAEAHGETTINIGQMSRANRYDFEVKPQEMVGFVFPVYFAGLPAVLTDFISKLRLQNYDKNYTFAIFTCGAIAGNTLKTFRHLLNQYNIGLDAGFGVKMVDNYILMLNLLPPRAKWRAINEACLVEIRNINDLIRLRHKGLSKKYATIVPHLLSAIQSNIIYNYGRSTKPFYATDNCINCGLCARVCPVQAIEIVDKKPFWTKQKCCQCLACLHRCPKTAIQYGKKTIKRGRYVNEKVSFGD
jgi:ferredoxin